MHTFEVTSGELVISDPSNSIDPPEWYSGKIKAKNGTWMVDITNIAFGRTTRVKEVILFSHEASLDNFKLVTELPYAPPLPYICGVDSGLISYVDAVHYRNDQSATELPEADDHVKPGDGWLRDVAESANNRRQYGLLTHGVVINTSVEGSYSTQALFNEDNECIGLYTQFIKTESYDETDEDDEWDDYEWDEGIDADED
jgi:hypothetical protein